MRGHLCTEKGQCQKSERGRDKRYSQAKGRARQQEPEGSKIEYHRDVEVIKETAG